MAHMETCLPLLPALSLWAGAGLTLLAGPLRPKAGRLLSALWTALALALVLALWPTAMGQGRFLLYETGPGGIRLTADALSLFSALLLLIPALSGALSPTGGDAHSRGLALLRTGAAVGLVFSGDLFHLFLMGQVMALTAVALLVRSDGEEGVLWAFRYLAQNAVTAAAELAGVVMVYTRLRTTDMADIAAGIPRWRGDRVLLLAFGLMFTGFAAKALLFPFHRRDLRRKLPALAGSGAVCGVYGLIRLTYLLFQNANTTLAAGLLLAFGAVSMLAGVTLAYRQRDLRGLLACLGLSQLGQATMALGLGTVLALGAALYQLLSLTLSMALLHLAAEHIEAQTGTLHRKALAGLSGRMPRTTALLLAGSAALAGLPPFGGFAARWMLGQALLETGRPLYAALWTLTLLTAALTLVPLLRLAEGLCLGRPRSLSAKDPSAVALLPLWGLVLLCVVTGLCPGGVVKAVVLPAVSAVADIPGYVDAALGAGTAMAHRVPGGPVYRLSVPWGLWTAAALLAAALPALLAPGRRHRLPSQGRLAPVFAGLAQVRRKVADSGGYRALLGLWRRYLRWLTGLYTGVVNDMVLYELAAMAAVMAVCCIW